MADTNIIDMSVGQMVAAFRSGRLSPVEAVAASLSRIDEVNTELNAVVTLADDAMSQARAAERAWRAGETRQPLLGVPVTVKDNILTKGLLSTMGSPLFRDHIPDEDSGVVARARAAGAIIIGKTNTPAFGWTGITDNMVFGPTRNPWNTDLTPGGSSGGAAVATATRMVPLSIGTDGGGSLRTPGAYTGTVGFKPSHGRIPDSPPHPHWIIQHYGPLVRDVRDAALFLDVAAGPDGADPFSLPTDSESFMPGPRHPKSLRVLFTTQLGWCGEVDDEIAAACRGAAARLRDLGWTVEEEALSWSDPAPFANVIGQVGFHHRLKDYRHRGAEIEEGIQAMLQAADRMPPHAFYDAMMQRNAWSAHSMGVFRRFDLLLTPATAALPFAIGKLAPETINGRDVAPSAWNPFLRAFNLTGQPALSLPVGFSRNGLPIGLQMVGPRHGDRMLLAAAAAAQDILAV